MLAILNQGLSIILSSFFGRLAFALLGGLILGFSLAGFGLGFLAWFALVPLFLLIKSSKSINGSIFDALVFLITFNLSSFIWLLALHPLTWQGLSEAESILVSILAWLTPSLTHSLILLPFCIALKLLFIFRADERSYELKILDIAFLAFLWVVIEYKFMLNLGENLRAFFAPINMLAYSQYKNLYLIQIVNVIGAIGLEFFIICVNLLLSNLFNVHKVGGSDTVISGGLNIRRQYFGIERASDYVSVSGIIFALIFGAYYYGYHNIKHYNYDRLSKPLKRVAILQADFSAKFTRSTEGFEKLIEMQKNLSLAIKPRLDFLFWTEGAIPRTHYDGKRLARELEGISKNFSYGTFILEEGKAFNSLKNFSFKDNLDNNEPFFQNLSQISVDHYKKNILVAFGEYTPFYDQLPANLQLLASHSVGSGFSASKEIKNISTPHGNYAPNICFEILFPEHVRKFINEDTDFIVNINDLSWFKNTVSVFGYELNFLKGFVQRMMLAAATFRAIENNRDLVLASNSGISTVIQATGAREKQSKVNSIEILEAKLLSQRELSLYNQYGF